MSPTNESVLYPEKYIFGVFNYSTFERFLSGGKKPIWNGNAFSR